MLLKTIIIILLIGVIASLGSGLVFLFKDNDKPGSRRTLHALGVRVTLAGALVATIFYGLYTGQLRMGTNAPWHGAGQAERTSEYSEDIDEEKQAHPDHVNEVPVP